MLGDGTQKKSYMHIDDCINAIFLVAEQKETAKSTNHNFDVFHLGNPEFIRVSDSAKIIINQMGLSAKINYSGGRQGWIGDNPFVFLNVEKIQSHGWAPQNNIESSVRQTVDWLNKNTWIMDSRDSSS